MLQSMVPEPYWRWRTALLLLIFDIAVAVLLALGIWFLRSLVRLLATRAAVPVVAHLGQSDDPSLSGLLALSSVTSTANQVSC